MDGPHFLHPAVHEHTLPHGDGGSGGDARPRKRENEAKETNYSYRLSYMVGMGPSMSCSRGRIKAKTFAKSRANLEPVRRLRVWGKAELGANRRNSGGSAGSFLGQVRDFTSAGLCSQHLAQHSNTSWEAPPPTMIEEPCWRSQAVL